MRPTMVTLARSLSGASAFPRFSEERREVQRKPRGGGAIRGLASL